MKVAIIGAGIIGLALARELRRRGAEVLLVDRQPPAREATWAAAGLLAPSSEADAPGDFFELCRAAAVMYPDYVRELEQETGLNTGYRSEGTLLLYHSEEERRALDKRFGWQRERGIPAVHMDAQELRVLEPELRARGGFLLPGDCQVDSRLLAAALVQACRNAGVKFREGAAASVIEEGGRAAGVALADGSQLPADAVVNAAGAWAPSIAAPGVAVEIRPVKGHMLALATQGWSLKHVLHDASVYLAPRAGGRVVIGSTMEEAGFDKTVNPAVIAQLRAAAERLVPRLAQAAQAETWTGLRPAAPDARPRIGPTRLPGYFLATGHFRNGILLGPLTARGLASVILGEKPDPLLLPFLPSR